MYQRNVYICPLVCCYFYFFYLYTLFNTIKSSLSGLIYTVKLNEDFATTVCTFIKINIPVIYHVGHLLNTSQNNLKKEDFFVFLFNFILEHERNNVV